VKEDAKMILKVLNEPDNRRDQAKMGCVPILDVLNRPRIRERRRCFVRLQLTIEVWKKGNWYLARTPELDFISQGMTQEEAKRNLLEVVKIQFTEMKEMGTIEDYLLECGFETKDNDIIPRTEMVGFEKSVVSV
jgi:predicted RNase H-like HicB family nuclease